MSEQLAPKERSPQPRFGAGAVVWGTIALFLALVTTLAIRVAAGQDPALRARATHLRLAPRRVLVRRVYERRVIVHLPSGAPPQRSQSSEQQLSTTGSYAPVPLTRTS